ncbi:MAG: antitoxin VapB family protein [Candidatus Bathyarchaeia archaeon]|nr:antitoxin VapB family protein [Candidatus Bathyarchaeota archaeon]
MGKVVMLSEEIYYQLKKIKRPEESFSDVISRLLKNKPKLLEIAGGKTISVKDWENLREAFRDRDMLDDVRRQYLLGLISE